MSLSRREVLVASATALAQSQPAANEKPNVVIVIADQVRWDAVGANGQNPMDVTPNLDAMAQRGTNYTHAFTNQPVCSPSRACLFTGQYPAKHGVWRNTGRGVALAQSATTLATEFRKDGYSANYVGKWHLAGDTVGPVSPAGRGGFLDLWEASNELEHTSHPYEGDLYDGDGRPLHFQNEYRVNFMTGRVKRFLQNVSKRSPFLLVASYLEPHQQNDLGHMVAPKGYADRYANPFAPQDLRPFPGTWQAQLPDYYGCLKSIDEAIGEIRSTLEETGLDRNTILVFTSDHGCHFMTRNTEYKRSGHDSSARIPLIIVGPQFEGGRKIGDLVSMVDLMPTLLSAAGLPVPSSVQGKSTLGLISGKDQGWRNDVFIQMSEFWVARALRTPEWTYVVAAPREGAEHKPAPNAPRYSAFQLYDNRADPCQLVNLAGRRETADIEEHLRQRLKARIVEAGDKPANLLPSAFPYS